MRNRKRLNPEDFKHLLSADVEPMEARYSGQSIYKYLNFQDTELLARFLSRPTIKFSHKDELEDKFELSKRWEQFGCPFDEKLFDKYVRKPVGSELSDLNAARKTLVAKAKERMPWLSRQERRKIISARVGRSELSNVRNDTLMSAAAIEADMPIVFSNYEAEFIHDFTTTTGILSLTANPVSPDMWDKYAADGRGFVLEYDASHEFFVHKSDDGTQRKLIRPVFYRDYRISDFWKNPYYLFLVKNSSWAVEEEWRVIRALDECQKLIRDEGSSLYYVDVPPNLISSVIFGYRNSSEFIADATSRLTRFDPHIKFKRAIVEDGSAITIKGL